MTGRTIESRGGIAVGAVLPRLVELGPPSEIRAHAPAVAAEVLDVDRVLLSAVRHGELVAEELHAPDVEPAVLEALRRRPVALGYPLEEAEVMRRRRAQVVETSRHRAFGETLGWSIYVAAPIVLDGRVIAFLHADRDPSGRSVDGHDAADLDAFALAFAVVFERAALRHRLRAQRDELRQIASWAEARGGELGDRAIELVEQCQEPQQRSEPERELRDLLTRRELEVLELMVRGDTNAEIARELVLSEGTVKFHVKNILRKLHASNRAEATSRYLRLTLRRP